MNWKDYVGQPEKAIDMGTGHILDNTNWPELYEAKLLVQRIADKAGLSGEEAERIEGLMCFLDVVQDYAGDELGVPTNLVFLHQNPDHYNHPHEEQA